jgi:epoxyqueuosine reductase
MRYLARTAAVRADPSKLLPGARSIVCLAWKHAASPAVAADGSATARYALGADYHGNLRQKALALVREAERRIGTFAWRVCVDSTPLAERSFAAAAGLGWIGKNGCLIDPERGSWLLLAEISRTSDLPTDEPIAEQCGSCVLPRGLPDGGLRSAGPAGCPVHRLLDDRAPRPAARFGQGVAGPARVRLRHLPGSVSVITSRSLLRGSAQSSAPTGAKEDPNRNCSHCLEWLEMGKGAWRKRFGATAFNRAHRRGLQRNAAASAGAVRDAACLPALPSVAALPDRGASEAARWALARLGPGPR